MDIFNSYFMLQTPNHGDHESLPSRITQDFHGVASVLGKRVPPSMSLINSTCNNDAACEDNPMNNNLGDDDLSDDDGPQYVGEKKRRLNVEQVRTLEKSFELTNKLEPERKMELAKTLGLQPRQIAIWFQNRRARWKTKQLEKDYEILKREFEAVKAENDALQTQNKKLQAEIMALKTGDLPTESINLNKDTEGSCSNRSSDNSSELIKLDISTTQIVVESSSLSTLFPSSSVISKPNVNGGMSHLFQINSNIGSVKPEISCPKMEYQQNIVKEESSLCNMFCAGMDDHTVGFWPWLEQHNFN